MMPLLVVLPEQLGEDEGEKTLVLGVEGVQDLVEAVEGELLVKEQATVH